MIFPADKVFLRWRTYVLKSEPNMTITFFRIDFRTQEINKNPHIHICPLAPSRFLDVHDKTSFIIHSRPIEILLLVPSNLQWLGKALTEKFSEAHDNPPGRVGTFSALKP